MWEVGWHSVASGESDFPGPSLLTPEDCVLYPTDWLCVLTGAYLVNQELHF